MRLPLVAFTLICFCLTVTPPQNPASSREISIHPGKETWSRFIEEINAAKLYRWTKLYADWDVMDGTHWSRIGSKN